MEKRQVIYTDKAPAAIGPYAQANKVGAFVFASGQIPIDPATGEIAGDDITTQTERVLENLSAVLKAAGSTLGDVVKTTVFLTDIGDFATVNEIYARYFTGEYLPSRSAVAVVNLPRGVKIEIEAIAVAE